MTPSSAKTQALLDLVEADRRQKCDAILAEARGVARRVLEAGARRRARTDAQGFRGGARAPRRARRRRAREPADAAPARRAAARGGAARRRLEEAPRGVAATLADPGSCALRAGSPTRASAPRRVASLHAPAGASRIRRIRLAATTERDVPFARSSHPRGRRCPRSSSTARSTDPPIAPASVASRAANVVDGTLDGLPRRIAPTSARSCCRLLRSRSADAAMSRASIRWLAGPVLRAVAEGPFALREVGARRAAGAAGRGRPHRRRRDRRPGLRGHDGPAAGHAGRGQRAAARDSARPGPARQHLRRSAAPAVGHRLGVRAAGDAPRRRGARSHSRRA